MPQSKDCGGSKVVETERRVRGDGVPPNIEAVGIKPLMSHLSDACGRISQPPHKPHR